MEAVTDKGRDCSIQGFQKMNWQTVLQKRLPVLGRKPLFRSVPDTVGVLILKILFGGVSDECN